MVVVHGLRSFPNQGLKLCPLHWQVDSATAPPNKHCTLRNLKQQMCCLNRSARRASRLKESQGPAPALACRAILPGLFRDLVVGRQSLVFLSLQ